MTKKYRFDNALFWGIGSCTAIIAVAMALGTVSTSLLHMVWPSVPALSFKCFTLPATLLSTGVFVSGLALLCIYQNDLGKELFKFYLCALLTGGLFSLLLLVDSLFPGLPNDGANALFDWIGAGFENVVTFFKTHWPMPGACPWQ